MFSKSIFVFGLLALLACQGASASSINEVEDNRASLGELIDQVKEVIASLEKLVSGTIGDALGTLGNLIGTLAELKKKFLDEGISAITGGIGNVVEFIKNKTQEAAELGIDISKCLTGRSEQLEQLGSGLVANLTDCVTTTVGSVVTMINKDIKVINQIVANVTAIPLKLSKCLISLRPITCVTSLLGDVTALLKSLPGQIAEIVNNATELVKALPAQLTGCVENIATSTASQTQAIIKDIGTCVDGVISGGEVAQRASLAELIDQVKQVIASLEKLVSGTIGDALGTLGNLIGTLAELKKKFLDEGISAITGGIGNVVEFIKNKTQEAAELGIDIGKCLTGRSEQLEQLGSGLVANLTDCVTTTVGSVVTMINKDIKVINQIVANVTAIPLKLTKCLISLRPITCVTSLLGDVTALLKSLPGQIAEIVNNATELVKALPEQLTGCVENIATSTASQTQAIIKEIGTCVDGIISGGTA